MIPMLFKESFSLKLSNFSPSPSPCLPWSPRRLFWSVRRLSQGSPPDPSRWGTTRFAFRDVALRWIQMPGPLTWWAQRGACTDARRTWLLWCHVAWRQWFVGKFLLGWVSWVGGFWVALGENGDQRCQFWPTVRNRRFVSMSCLSGKLFTGTSCEGRQHLPKPDRVFSCSESAWEKHRRFYSPVWWSWTCIYYIHHVLRYDGVHYIRSQWDMRNCFPLGPVRLTLGWWGWRITKAPDWGVGERAASARDKDVAEWQSMHFRLFFFPLKISLEWFPLISTSIFLFACEFSTLPSRCMWCFCRRTKGLGFWALVGILDIPPPTQDHIHLVSEIETRPKEETQVIWRYYPMRNYRVARHWATFDLRRHFFFFFATKDWYNSQVKYTLVSPGYKYNPALGLQALKTL